MCADLPPRRRTARGVECGGPRRGRCPQLDGYCDERERLTPLALGFHLPVSRRRAGAFPLLLGQRDRMLARTKDGRGALDLLSDVNRPGHVRPSGDTSPIEVPRVVRITLPGPVPGSTNDGKAGW